MRMIPASERHRPLYYFARVGGFGLLMAVAAALADAPTQPGAVATMGMLGIWLYGHGVTPRTRAFWGLGVAAAIGLIALERLIA